MPSNLSNQAHGDTDLQPQPVYRKWGSFPVSIVLYFSALLWSLESSDQWHSWERGKSRKVGWWLYCTAREGRGGAPEFHPHWGVSYPLPWICVPNDICTSTGERQSMRTMWEGGEFFRPTYLAVGLFTCVLRAHGRKEHISVMYYCLLKWCVSGSYPILSEQLLNA